MPVLSRTKAMEEIQQREGSRARNPHSSSRSKPLGDVGRERDTWVRMMRRRQTRGYLMHNMSIRCCSAMLFSLLTLRCSAVKMLLFSRRYLPHSRLRSSMFSLAIPFASVEAVPPFGGMEKYSNSSRRTMMACFERRGFWLGAKSEEGDASMRCCCARRRPGDASVP
jgi:hypothetical protein